MNLYVPTQSKLCNSKHIKSNSHNVLASLQDNTFISKPYSRGPICQMLKLQVLCTSRIGEIFKRAEMMSKSEADSKVQLNNVCGSDEMSLQRHLCEFDPCLASNG